MSSPTPVQDTPLLRALSLPLAILYGLGTIVGAGIYVLVGEVVVSAGAYTPLAFLLAGAIAALTAFSYAELVARFPYSAGEAVYVREGFGSAGLATLVGLGVVAIGVVSAATMVRGFFGYFEVFAALPSWVVITALVLAMGAVAAWGIRESAWLAAAITLLEIGGLVAVVIVVRVGGDGLSALDATVLPPLDAGAWPGILAGAVLAFYAFIGFEDMVNVAEEVREPSRNLPRAILWALVLSLGLYLTVVFAVMRVASPDDLARSQAPMALVWSRATGGSPLFITALSMIAIVNGALIQLIMVSRVLYGMGQRGWLPRWLSRVHPRTRTPLQATLGVTLLIWMFALWLPLVTLAQITSAVTLLVFAAIHLALWRLRRDRPTPPQGIGFPRWVPLLGAASALALFGVQVIDWLWGGP